MQNDRAEQLRRRANELLATIKQGWANGLDKCALDDAWRELAVKMRELREMGLDLKGPVLAKKETP